MRKQTLLMSLEIGQAYAMMALRAAFNFTTANFNGTSKYTAGRLLPGGFTDGSYCHRGGL